VKHNTDIARRVFFIAFFFSLICICRESNGGEFFMKPSLTLSEEYDDNIFLTSDNKVGDFITRVIPSVKLTYKTPIWDLALDDTFTGWYYAKQGTSYTANNANLSSKLIVIKNLFYFDVTDSMANVVLNPRGPSTTSNLNVNQTNSNIANAMPYLKYQIDTATEAKAGVTYTNIWYNSEGTNRQQYDGLFTITHALDPKLNALLGAEYLADRPEGGEPDDDQTSVYASLFYTFDPRTKFDGTAGYKWTSISDASDYNKPVYNVGVVYQLPRKGQIELRATSSIAVSPEQGLVDSVREQLTVKYGEPVSINGSIYQERDTYFQIGQTNDAAGVIVGLIYAPNRMTYKIAGTYEKDRYQPQDANRDLYSVSAGISYKLTAKATVGLTDDYNKSNGQIEGNTYTDNIVRLSLTIFL
jgi:hypothetical protein